MSASNLTDSEEIGLYLSEASSSFDEEDFFEEEE